MKSDTYVNFAGEIFQNFRRLVYTVTLKMNDDYLIIVGTFLFFPSSNWASTYFGQED